MTACKFLSTGMIALAAHLAAQAQVLDNEAAVRRGDEALRESLGELQAVAADPTIFVKSAAMGGLAVVELSKLAGTNSQDASVKNLAARLLEDQSRINAELARVATRQGFYVPTSLNGPDEDMVKEAAAKRGEEFDRWYSQRMLQELERAIPLFQAATLIPDSPLAPFAKKTLPLLADRQEMLRELDPAHQ